MQDISDGKVFFGFKEAECQDGGVYRFHPTFKVKRVDASPEVSYTDERTPSWCDRVLWRSMPGVKDNIKQVLLG